MSSLGRRTLSRDWGRGLGCDLCSVAALAESSFGEATDLFSVLLALTAKITEQRRQTPKVANTVLEACLSASVGFGASTQRKFPTPDGRFRHWETFCEAGPVTPRLTCTEDRESSKSPASSPANPSVPAQTLTASGSESIQPIGCQLSG